MKIIKTVGRKIIFPTLLGISFDKIIRYTAQNSLLNLVFHGVVNVDSTHFSGRNIHKDQFEKMLIYFKKNFDIISVHEAFKMMSENRITSRPTITISFDDGLQNNLYTALPLLEKYEIPATFFISSICVEDMEIRCLWAEKIAALKYFFNNETISVDNYEFIRFMDKNKKISIEDLIKKSDFHYRDIILENLVKKYNLGQKLKEIPEEAWQLLSSKEVQKLAESNFVDIGSHGHSHFNLGNIGADFAMRELKKSKTILSDLIKREVNMIAYPDGSYNDEIKNIAQSVGYEYQLAVNYMVPTDLKDSRILDRYCISSTTTFESNVINLHYSIFKKGKNYLHV